MPETTIKEFQTAYAGIRRKVEAQEEALSPDAIADASVPELAAANGEILADLQALRERIEASQTTLQDGRVIFKHEYAALQQLARENGVDEEEVLWRLREAKIRGGQVGTINLSFLNLSSIAALGGLSGLVELNLGLNAIQGDPQFPALLKLQKLDLYGNQITGVSGLRHLTMLKTLSLVENDLQNDQLFPALPHLQALILFSNPITGVSGLSPLTGLKTLVVDASTRKLLGPQLKKLKKRGVAVDVSQAKKCA